MINIDYKSEIEKLKEEIEKKTKENNNLNDKMLYSIAFENNTC